MKITIVISLLVCLVLGCRQTEDVEDRVKSAAGASTKDSESKNVHPIAAAARYQIGKTVKYDPAYVGLDYPNGDLPIETGVCTDVVVRALRRAYAMDLQKLMHEDMKKNFSKYPKIWGLKRPDKNIDHRRVPNIMTYLKRSGDALPLSNKDFRAGDIVSCIVGRNMAHIMIVSDSKSAKGVPLVIHNYGNGTQETDSLESYRITGHYRIVKK